MASSMIATQAAMGSVAAAKAPARATLGGQKAFLRGSARLPVMQAAVQAQAPRKGALVTKAVIADDAETKKSYVA